MTKDIPTHFMFESGGMRFCVRPIYPDDKDLLQRGFSELSEMSKYMRFFQIRNKLSDSQLIYFSEVDGIHHIAWGILDETGEESIPVGVGRFVQFKDEKDTAEMAITVIDDYQRKGLGWILFAILNIMAGQVGLKRLRYYVLGENRFVLKALKKLGVIEEKNESQATTIDIKVFPNHQAIPDEPEMQGFKEAMKMVEDKMSS